jgi:hypothetical protein
MTLDSLIMLCGALVAILPFLGFPNTWDTVMFAVLGSIIVALGVVVRRRTPRKSSTARDAHFVDHVPERSKGSALHGEE